MCKAILSGVVAIFLGMTQPARAQFCPGVSPWVFDDVAASDPFCGYITWMAENGITLGCQTIDANHRLYCPNANVSRAAMAAFMNRLGNVRVEAVDTGPGLTGGPITSVGTINLATTQLLPTVACASGQVAQWNGSAWTCANVSGTGTVTSVGSGTGLAGGPITTSGTLSIAASYQLPQSCANGQVAKSNGSGGWACANDANSGGTVTSVATGAGLTGGPITTAGTINLAATQLLPTVACTNGQVAQWNGSAWACATPSGVGANINLQDSTSAAVGNVTKPGGAFLHNFGTGNVFAGVNAGNFAMTGVSNAGFGYQALQSNTVADNNTALGAFALQSNATGTANVATGAFALNSNTTGSSNSANGAFALRYSTTGDNNTALGAFALGAITAGSDNVAIGAGALRNATASSGATAVGVDALANNSGNGNTAIGRQALAANTTAVFNTAVGESALWQNTGGQNTAIGYHALAGNTTGTWNTAIGINAMSANVTGQQNTAIGHAALANTGSGYGNTAVGYAALDANTTGCCNAAVGTNALINNTTASGNTALGHSALYANVTGASNVAVGAFSLNNNSAGSDNIAVGKSALQGNTNGHDNTASGSGAMELNTTGAFNTAYGSSVLFANTSGNQNTAVGANALFNNATGSHNIALGESAGTNLTTGSYNIDIGHAGIAAEAQTIRIGDTNQTRAFVAGIRGVTTGSNNAINVVIDSNGQLGTLSSSRNVKDDIADMGDASSVLAKLHPVTFRYKAHEGAGPVQYGLIAEEVAEVAPGLVATGRDGAVETVFYQHLPPMLLNEYQKQQRTIEAQARRIDAQEAEIAALRQDRTVQSEAIAELRRAVEVLMARTSPEGRIAAK
ncbi:MAG: tail fiber domain-containing protein [Burkholderiales bacterium]